MPNSGKLSEFSFGSGTWVADSCIQSFNLQNAINDIVYACNSLDKTAVGTKTATFSVAMGVGFEYSGSENLLSETTPGTVGAFSAYPGGNTFGNIKASASSAIVVSSGLSAAPSGLLQLDISFRLNDITLGTAGVLLLDDFTTDSAAPIASPRTAEPGPGTLLINDSGNNLTLSSGDLLAAGIVGASDPRVISSSTFTRAAGMTLFVDVTWTTSRGMLGWVDNATPTGSPLYGVGDYSGTLQMLPFSDADGQYSTATNYQHAIILRDTGAMLITKGGVYTDWTLVWAWDSGTTANLYASIYANDADFSLSAGTMRVCELIAPFNSDYGLSTDSYIGAVTPPQSFTHEADCIIEFVATAVSTGPALLLDFRIQDSDNYLAVYVTNAGTVIIGTVVNTAYQWYASSSVGAVSANSRIVVVAVDSAVKIYVDDTLEINETIATFKTETAGKFSYLGSDGTIKDLIAWPRNITGTANDILDDLEAL